jgi:superoxide reductase
MGKEYTFLKADCNLIVCTLNSSDCIPTCNGKEMEVLSPNIVDASIEKHKPVVTKAAGGILVSCGEVPHPMEEKHHIEWLSVHDGNLQMFHVLHPGEKPEVFFPIDKADVTAYAYCDLHGLWKNK